MTSEDTSSTTEAEAARAANVIGRSEWVGSDVGSQEPDVAWAKGLGPDPWGLPEPSPTTPLELPAEPPF